MAKVRVTHSTADLEAWLAARVAKGAARIVLMAEDRPHGARVPCVVVMTWEVGASFDARNIARYVQKLADAVVILGDPREHFDLWSYRSARSKPSARITVYGQDPRPAPVARACAGCAHNDARIATLTEHLRKAHAMVDEAHARNGRLDEIIRKQHDQLTAADARASPWAFTRIRRRHQVN